MVTTTATGESTTAAMAAAAAEAAEEGAMAAGSNPVSSPDTNLLCVIYLPFLHYWHKSCFSLFLAE